MRITKALIQQKIDYVLARYKAVMGREIDTSDGYAQCSKFSTERPNAWTCSPAENAHRLYGEYSALRDLL